MKRMWKKLFGRTTATSDASSSEQNRDRADMVRQQAERQRLQDEMSLRAGRNTIGF